MIGFSDTSGDFVQRLEQSNEDAINLAQDLIRVSDSRLFAINNGAAGYGNLAPLICDEDPAGHALNRRVEVWVRRVAQ